MKQKKKIIGIDLDDVLLDFNGALCIFHNVQYGTSLTREQIFSFHLEKVWGCTKDEAKRRIVEFYHTDFHRDASPIQGATEAIQELSRNNSLIIITGKPERLQTATTHWLDRYFPRSFDGLYFTNQFLGDDIKRTKAELCSDLGIEVFIDDSIAYTRDIASKGVRAFLFDAPWNQGELSPLVTRVYSWKGVLEKLGK